MVTFIAILISGFVMVLHEMRNPDELGFYHFVILIVLFQISYYVR